MQNLLGFTRQWSTGIWALLLDSFASNLGFYLLVPVLAVHLTKDLGWAAWSAGLILAVRQLAQQGLAPWGGAWGDRLGYRTAVVLGMEIRAVGFGLFAWAHAPWLIAVAAVLSGLGGALFGPADAAALAVSVDGDRRAAVFSQRVVFGNAGMIVGPVVGAYLVTSNFALVALLAAGLFLVAGIFTGFYYPAQARAPRRQEREPAAFGQVWANRPFVHLTALLSGYYLLSSQINILIPLVVVYDRANPSLIGWSLAVYSALTIALQTRVTRRMTAVLVERQLFLGLLAATLGMLICACSEWTVWALFPGVMALSAASMLVTPAMFQATARLADERAFGLFYGFSRLSLGIGGSVGNAVGGALFSFGSTVGFLALPWAAMACMGGASALLMTRLRLTPPSASSEAGAVG